MEMNVLFKLFLDIKMKRKYKVGYQKVIEVLRVTKLQSMMPCFIVLMKNKIFFQYKNKAHKKKNRFKRTIRVYISRLVIERDRFRLKGSFQQTFEM